MKIVPETSMKENRFTQEEIGQQELGGTETELVEDDNVVEGVHKVGIGLGEDDDRENPQPLNLGGELQKAERLNQEGPAPEK